jgi:hypothetical protein
MRHGTAYLKLKSTDAFFLNERFSVTRIPASDSDPVTTGVVIRHEASSGLG